MKGENAPPTSQLLAFVRKEFSFIFPILAAANVARH